MEITPRRDLVDLGCKKMFNDGDDTPFDSFEVDENTSLPMTPNVDGSTKTLCSILALCMMCVHDFADIKARVLISTSCIADIKVHVRSQVQIRYRYIF